MRFEAIIFDCDGTLVDSEHLGNRVLVEYLSELGLDLSLAEALGLFTGLGMANTIALIEERLGRPVPEDFEPELRDRMAITFGESLRPVAGVEAVLRSVKQPYCVASNATRDKTERSLRTTGLLGYFGERIFSAYDIGSFKPEPGLFLHAAEALGVAPERCAVVEDSIVGVRAGRAAGMAVFGFAPSGNAAVLAGAGAEPFEDMAGLLPLLHRGWPGC
jgi:HAD superfamily hydrolase (TIGR01509 family)